MSEAVRAMSTAFDPVLTPPPDFDFEHAHALLEREFGLSGELERLYGERDLNFMVTSSRGRFVLKFHSSADSADVVDMQTQALAHVSRIDPKLAVPSVVSTVHGTGWHSATAPDGRSSFVQLLTFLDGHRPQPDDLGEHALYELGRLLARLGRAMRSFFHPAAANPTAWDIRLAPQLRSWLSGLKREQREAVASVLERFETHAQPMLARLRSQVIHNDVTHENLLLDDHGGIVGVVDFGDITHTNLICDLAVSLTNLLAARKDGLEIARPVIAGYQAVTPLEPEEISVLGDLVAARCAISVVLSAWRDALPGVPALEEHTWPLLQLIGRQGFETIKQRFMTMSDQFGAGTERRSGGRSTSDLLEARLGVLGPAALSYNSPVHLTRGDGVYLYTREGLRLLDAYNNVPVVGHCHPAVVAAVTAQMRLLNSNTRYLQEAPVELAERLIESAPGHFDRVLFVNSGSEANDVAWRISCAARRSHGAIVTRFAYHGITHAVTDLSPSVWPPGMAPSNVRVVSPPGARTPLTARERDRPEHAQPMDYRSAVTDLLVSGEGVAAMYIDCAFSSDGILNPPADWIQGAAAAIRAGGGLFIADEVQAGFGRTGRNLWSISSLAVEPDMMTIGKPMGNGFPVAAILTRSELVDHLLENNYFSSFGGNTAACVAALTVLRVIEEEGLIDNARRVGDYLLAGLVEVASHYRSAGAARGWGLYAGLDIISPDDGSPDATEASRIVNHMRRSGVLIGTTGSAANILKIRPPLVFEHQHVDLLLNRLEAALAEEGTAR